MTRNLLHKKSDVDGLQERPDWPVMISAEGKNRFLFVNSALNVHGSHYHIREPETALMANSFADFTKVGWLPRDTFRTGSRMGALPSCDWLALCIFSLTYSLLQYDGLPISAFRLPWRAPLRQV